MCAFRPNIQLDVDADFDDVGISPSKKQTVVSIQVYLK